MNLQSLIEQQKTDLADFVEIDQTLRELRNGAEPNQLPPANPAVGEQKQFVMVKCNELTRQSFIRR
jgi:hypothetical protein